MMQTPNRNACPGDADQALRLPAGERRARAIGLAALQSLHQELAAYPKPGLVSPVDSGSHRDMDAPLFFRSLFSLRSYYRDIALAGMRQAPFAKLKTLGITAEARMLKATAGVNTHRGAIFNLGLLAAAAGFVHGTQGLCRTQELGGVVRRQWGEAIAAHGRSLPNTSHGSQVASQHGAGGALAEAVCGFPHVFEVGLPVLLTSLARGADDHAAAVQCLFSLMAVLVDTNLLYRGGSPGLKFAQTCAREFLRAGGVHRADWQRHALDIHRTFINRRLSPGGSADLLGATLFVHRLAG